MKAYKFERPRSHYCEIVTIRNVEVLQRFIENQKFPFISEIKKLHNTTIIKQGWYLFILLSRLTGDKDIKQLEELVDSWHNGIEFHSLKYRKKLTTFLPNYSWRK